MEKIKEKEKAKSNHEEELKMFKNLKLKSPIEELTETIKIKEDKLYELQILAEKLNEKSNEMSNKISNTLAKINKTKEEIEGYCLDKTKFENFIFFPKIF